MVVDSVLDDTRSDLYPRPGYEVKILLPYMRHKVSSVKVFIGFRILPQTLEKRRDAGAVSVPLV